MTWENLWANDIDGSALAAQPGKSQGRPLKRPGSNTPLVSMKEAWLSSEVGGVGRGPSLWSWASGAHLSMACSTAGQGGIGGRLRGLKSKRAVRRPDEKRSLPGRERRAHCG